VIALIIIVVAIIALVAHSRVTKLRMRVDRLESDYLELSGRFKQIKTPGTEETEGEPERLAAAEKAKEPVASIASIEPAAEEKIPAPAGLISTAKKEAEPEKPKSHTREEWESFIGGKLLNRIGALALIIGLGFFLKYAFDNNWISETVRVLTGAAAGFVCLGLAYRTHKKGYQIFSQGLVGAGIAILYLSVYASFNFYSLVPQWIAFVLMSCVTALSLALGVYYDSLAIGVLGWAGGFLTPIMLSTGSANEIGLFTYIALLNVGLLAVIVVKAGWGTLEPCAWAATWIMYFAWYFKFYRETDLIVTVFFVSLFWLLFLSSDFARLRLLTADTTPLQHIVAAFNPVVYYVVLYGLIDYQHHDWTAPATVAIAAVYIAAYRLLKPRTALPEIVTIRYVITAITLAVMATAIQFEDFQTVIGWAIEAAALLWIGIRRDRKFVLYSAVALFALAGIKLIGTHGAFAFAPIESFRVLFNERCLAFLVLALALSYGADRIPPLTPDNAALANAFHFAWCGILFALVTVETADLLKQALLTASGSQAVRLDFLRPLVFSAIWLILSLPLLWIGLRRILVPLIVSALSLLVLAAGTLMIFGLEFVPASEFVPLFNARAGVFILALGTVLFNYRRMAASDGEQRWVKSISSPLLYLFAILLFTFVTIELNDYFRQRMIDAAGEALTTIRYLRTTALAGAWAALSLPFILIYRKKELPELLISGLLILLAGECFIAAGGIEYSPVASFRLILNSRFSCGLFVVAVLFVHQSLLAHDSLKSKRKRIILQSLQIGIIAIALILLTGETRDYFEREIVVTGVAGEALRNLNNLEQLSLSGAWLLFSVALMALGFRRSLRNIRIIAFILFGFTILKIFIYDLSYLETLYRIFSFIGLGLILLAVSYAYQRYKEVIFGSRGEVNAH
jgi:uncharacterized membrane protein